MSDSANISINIPTHARSRNDTPYVQHTEFIKYCKANKVDVNEYALETYEKRKLLFPCIRLLYPRELLRRRYRAVYIANKRKYKILDKWQPLLSLENSIHNCSNWMDKSFSECLENGHPLEQHFSDDLQPFVLNPQKQRFRVWKRYKVIIDDSSRGKESRAEHYYAPWQVFFLHELDQQNTDTHNRATGVKKGWGVFDSSIVESRLVEFIPFFEKVGFFSYRRNLYRLYLDRKANSKEDWDCADKKLALVAEHYLQAFPYKNWIRFLRKLIEIYEKSKKLEKILLSLEAETYIARTVGFLRFATGHAFQKICDDVAGPFKNSLSRGSEDGVDIYQGALETLFLDETRDLEKNFKWMLEENLKELNANLIEEERLPESLYLQLFDELSESPQCTALAAIRKINKVYWGQELWRENDMWSGYTDLAISIEGHGKDWIRKKRKLEGIFKELFGAKDYQKLRQKKGKISLEPNNMGEFIQNLKCLLESKEIPEDRRCGKHLLITYLIRNFSAHNLGGFSGLSQDERSKIYIALVRTLFVMYANHKGL